MSDTTDAGTTEELGNDAGASHAQHDSFRCSIDDDDDDDDDDNDAVDYMPRILIVSQVPDAVFEEHQAQEEFQSLFLDFESSAQFHYLKKFRRARVEFDSVACASRARSDLHEYSFMGSNIKCHFAQRTDGDKSPSQYLQPPQPQRQYLISPPGSPPDGWEPVKERAPAINYDLITAIANLSPGETHEVHTASSSQPGIVVHVCEDPENFKQRPKIVPTCAPHAVP